MGSQADIALPWAYQANKWLETTAVLIFPAHNVHEVIPSYFESNLRKPPSPRSGKKMHLAKPNMRL